MPKKVWNTSKMQLKRSQIPLKLKEWFWSVNKSIFCANTAKFREGWTTKKLKNGLKTFLIDSKMISTFDVNPKLI